MMMKLGQSDSISYFTRDSPKKNGKHIKKGIRQDRLQIWAMFMNENPDYDYHYFLNLLKFKLEWMIFYWENFGHLARAEQDISRMRIATKAFGYYHGRKF